MPGKKSGRIFCVRQVLYLTKSCQQIWVRVNQPFVPFIHHIWREINLGQNAVFHNFAIQIALIQYHGDDRSQRGLLAKPLKKFPKSPIRPACSHFCSASCGRVFEWTLIELRSNIIKNLLCSLFIYNNCFIHVYKSSKAYDTGDILITPASDVY